MIWCGKRGLDGEEPTFRKKEPSSFRMRLISLAHARHHSMYWGRGVLSLYFEYSISRLYGGEVTTRSTDPPGRFGMTFRQSPSISSAFTMVWKGVKLVPEGDRLLLRDL